MSSRITTSPLSRMPHSNTGRSPAWRSRAGRSPWSSSTPSLTPLTSRWPLSSSLSARCTAARSSTTRTREKRGSRCSSSPRLPTGSHTSAGTEVHSGIGTAFSSTGSGITKRKVVPCSGALRTSMSPPIRRTSSWLIDSPRPVPPKRCATEADAWLKFWNSRRCSSRVMPMPLSLTVNSIIARPSRSSRQRAPTRIQPWRVNLIALDSKLVSTWRSRGASPRSCAGISASASTSTRSPLSLAGRLNMCAQSISNAAGSNGDCSSSSLPASSLA